MGLCADLVCDEEGRLKKDSVLEIQYKIQYSTVYRADKSWSFCKPKVKF